MIGNIIVILFILGWSAFSIYLAVSSYIKSKKDNIPRGCFSCAAYKSGNCHKHGNCGSSLYAPAQKSSSNKKAK